MTTKEWAALLNGRQYRAEMTNKEAQQARDDGIVIVHGGSDDLCYFAGATSDELGCNNGGTFYLSKVGLLVNDCENDECPHFEKARDYAASKGAFVKAVWDGGTGYSWTYETPIPHETFDIMEDDDKYCRGIVFWISHVPA